MTTIKPEELPHGLVRIALEVEAKDAEGNRTGYFYDPYDLGTQALAQFIICNILAGSATITDVTNTGQSITANDAATAPFINAGTNSSAANFTDYKLGTTSSTYKANGSYAHSATIGAIASNTFTVTGTVTNVSGGNLTYTEVGISITCATFQFLLSHDVFTGLTVSNNGTLAVTYTLTFT